jgi:transposase-like protein
VDQKRLFVADYQRGSFSMAELCRRYGVSRPTGYKWIERFEGEGVPGLEERSRRPRGCSHETVDERILKVEDALGMSPAVQRMQPELGTAPAANQQDERRHVADDEGRAREDGYVPLGGQMRDGPSGRRMREGDDEVEGTDQRRRPSEASSRAPTALQAEKG